MLSDQEQTNCDGCTKSTAYIHIPVEGDMSRICQQFIKSFPGTAYCPLSYNSTVDCFDTCRVDKTMAVRTEVSDSASFELIVHAMHSIHELFC